MWGFEKRSLQNEELNKGLLSPVFLPIIFFSTIAIYLGTLGITSSSTSMNWEDISYLTILAFILSRLIALDMCHHVLPDIYTLPLIVIGFAFQWPNYMDSLWGIAIAFSTASFIILIPLILKRDLGIGGGDLKLFLVIGVWISPYYFFSVITTACLITLVMTFLKKDRNEIPMGPGLCIALWIALLIEYGLYTPTLFNLSL